MASITKSGPLEIWLDRIGDYNPQLMRELRGKLKLSPVLATVGGAIALNCALYKLASLMIESGSDGMQVWLQCLMTCQFLSIVIACHQLTDNLAGEVQDGTINPLRLSPQTSGQILWGKALGIPVSVYLFNLLCLPVYWVVSLISHVSIGTIAITLISSCTQMTLWLSLSMVLGVTFRQSKNFTTFSATIIVLVGLGIQRTYGFLLPGVLGFVVPLAGSYIFWENAKNRFYLDKSTQSTTHSQWTASPSQSSQIAVPKVSVPKTNSAATPAKSIRALEPIFDRIGDINPQLMRELRGRLTANSVLWILSLSIVPQIFLVAYNVSLGWLPGLLQWTIVIGSYQLIRNWSAEEDQGTFNPIRLSPQSAGQIIWGKLLGVPSPVYLFALSWLPLCLIASIGQGYSIGVIISTLATGLIQTGFWFTASLLFASLAAKTPGAKSILGSIIVGLSLGFQNLVTANASASTWLNPLLWFFCSALVPLAGSYLCWQAIARRFHRPSATLWSKGQTYVITAIASLCILPFGLEALPVLAYLILVQGLLLIQPRQVLFDWARRPAVQLPAVPNLVQNRPTAQRSDLIWGESSPPLVAIGVHFGIVAIGIGAYCLWNIGSIGTVLSQNALSLSAALLLANLVTLCVGLTQILQLYLRRQVAAHSLLFNMFLLGAPLFWVALINVDNNPLGLLTLYPWAALATHSPGYTIAALCLQWTGIAMVYKQFDRSLSRLAKSDFARALEPTPSSRPQES